MPEEVRHCHYSGVNYVQTAFLKHGAVTRYPLLSSALTTPAQLQALPITVASGPGGRHLLRTEIYLGWQKQKSLRVYFVIINHGIQNIQFTYCNKNNIHRSMINIILNVTNAFIGFLF